MKPYVIFILTIVISLFSATNGGKGGAFLRYGIDARGEGLGRALVAEDRVIGYSSFYNPSVLTQVEKHSFQASYRSLSLDRTLGNVGVEIPLTGAAGAAINWIYGNTSNIEKRDYDGNKYDTFNYMENMFSLSFAIQLKNGINLGINGKYLLAVVPEFDATDESVYASGIAADIGLSYQHQFSFGDLSVGGVAKNIKGSFKWNTKAIYKDETDKTDTFPKSYEAGLKFTPKDYQDFAFYFAGSYSSEEYKELKGGVEYSHNFEKSSIFLRTGIDNGIFGGGFGARFTIDRYMLDFDYAYRYEEMGDSEPNTFSIKFLF